MGVCLCVYWAQTKQRAEDERWIWQYTDVLKGRLIYKDSDPWTRDAFNRKLKPETKKLIDRNGFV